jgi:hypothetical protein
VRSLPEFGYECGKPEARFPSLPKEEEELRTQLLRFKRKENVDIGDGLSELFPPVPPYAPTDGTDKVGFKLGLPPIPRGGELLGPDRGYAFLNASTAFSPPNANEFDSAYSTCAARDLLGITSRSHSASGIR